MNKKIQIIIDEEEFSLWKDFGNIYIQHIGIMGTLDEWNTEDKKVFIREKKKETFEQIIKLAKLIFNY